MAHLIGVVTGFTIGGLLWGWIIMLIAGMIWHETGIGVPFGMFPVSFVLGVFISLVMYNARVRS